MSLLRVAVALLFLPTAAIVQAADVSRMGAVNARPAPSGVMAPNVGKTPPGSAPVAVPYPNVVRGTGAVKENSPGVPTVKIDQGNVPKTSAGNEPGTLKETVNLNTKGPTVIMMGAPSVKVETGGAVLLNPLDMPTTNNSRAPKPDAPSDTGQQDQFRLQEGMQRESRNATSISNVRRQKDESESNTINNIK